MYVWMYGCMYSTLAFIEQGGRGGHVTVTVTIWVTVWLAG